MPEILERSSSHNRLTTKRKLITGGAAIILAASAAFALNENSDHNRPDSKPTPTTQPALETTTTLPAPTTTVEKPASGELSDWRVIGSPEAQKDIRDSLKLIRNMENQSYWQIVEKFHPTFIADRERFGVFPHIKTVRINDEERNYYGTDTDNPQINEANKKYNKIWLAGQELHESVQGVFFLAGQAWSDANAENTALVIQSKFLTEAGATADMINTVDSQIDPTDSPNSYWNRFKDGLMVQPPTNSTTLSTLK